MATPNPPIAEQLRLAWRDSGLTLQSLAERARIGCSAESLSRKLAGKQVLTTAEAERLAEALTLRLVWTPAASREVA